MKRTELKRTAGLKRKAQFKRTPMKRRNRPKMTPIRASAKGKPCMVRLPGVCLGGTETTVLAHYRMPGYCGTGAKPEDFAFGAWACHACHDSCDGRAAVPGMGREEVRLAHAEGVLRTQAELTRIGMVRVSEGGDA